MARILIADDEPGQREPLAFHLSAAGHHLTLASDGYDALALIARERPDVVLLDVMMPRKDGFEVLQALRKVPETQALPVLMLIARTADEEPFRGWWGPYWDYMVKSVDLTEAAARLNWIVRTGRTAPLVLVADDEPHLRRPIAAGLRAAGLRVDSVGSGAETLERAANSLPDLVILDHMMPYMDGLEVMQRLRGDARTAAVPVILLLGKTADASVYRKWEQAAEYWLTRPVSVDQLVKGAVQLLMGEEPSSLNRHSQRLQSIPGHGEARSD